MNASFLFFVLILLSIGVFAIGIMNNLIPFLLSGLIFFPVLFVLMVIWYYIGVNEVED